MILEVARGDEMFRRMMGRCALLSSRWICESPMERWEGGKKDRWPRAAGPLAQIVRFLAKFSRWIHPIFVHHSNHSTSNYFGPGADKSSRNFFYPSLMTRTSVPDLGKLICFQLYGRDERINIHTIVMQRPRTFHQNSVVPSDRPICFYSG